MAIKDMPLHIMVATKCMFGLDELFVKKACCINQLALWICIGFVILHMLISQQFILCSHVSRFCLPAQIMMNIKDSKHLILQNNTLIECSIVDSCRAYLSIASDVFTIECVCLRIKLNVLDLLALTPVYIT